MVTQQAWCRVTLYNPTVLKIGNTYKMWYLGNSYQTRISDLGNATSYDGQNWTHNREQSAFPVTRDRNRFDNAGIYGHIGVAQCAKTEINL